MTPPNLPTLPARPSLRTSTLPIFILLAGAHIAVFWPTIVASFQQPTWLIAPIMALGSFVAGSTFLGGGAIAFPALTKLLASSPSDAKTFSLAIQSMGMSAASLYIMVRVKALPWSFISLYVLAASAGLTLALGQLEQIVQPVDLRIGFSLFLLSFLFIYLKTRDSKNKRTETHIENTWRDWLFTLMAGFSGGIISGLLGSGADLIGFSLLALYFGIEIKRATQISVILMAATAVIGFSMQALVFERVSGFVWSLWYLAAPVVILGAPIGAAFCRRVKSTALLILICLIVSTEVISTLVLVPINQERLSYYAASTLICLLLLLALHHQAKYKHEKIKS